MKKVRYPALHTPGPSTRAAPAARSKGGEMATAACRGEASPVSPSHLSNMLPPREKPTAAAGAASQRARSFSTTWARSAVCPAW